MGKQGIAWVVGVALLWSMPLEAQEQKQDQKPERVVNFYNWSN